MAGEIISSISHPPGVKKKRNLPGTPDPDAEVIALSPKTLLATNRFLCEICGKGFQRDQNLQLHRRGHNLPWKLRQRSSKEPRKRVYVCPEKGCVHHNPSRALGDLTGIKKHFCRKHGEKKWKCEKCGKKYAVQSDWKAHSKTCGTREYRCDCGTIFSRRDSFITHRAFCDALAEETARISAASNLNNLPPPFNTLNCQLTTPTPHDFTITDILQPISTNPFKPTGLSLWTDHGPNTAHQNLTSNMHHVELYGDHHQFASLSNAQQLESQLNLLYGNKLLSRSSGELTSTSSAKEFDSSNSLLESVPSLFSTQENNYHPPLDTSATALLQKAALMGVTSSVPPFIRGFDMKMVQSSQCQDGNKFDGLFNIQSNPSLNFDLASSLENSITDFAVSNTFDVGGETRDFLGVGVQTLRSSSINGWI